eukprot:1277527-Rhodomonas_salina.1
MRLHPPTSFSTLIRGWCYQGSLKRLLRYPGTRCAIALHVYCAAPVLRWHIWCYALAMRCL